MVGWIEQREIQQFLLKGIAYAIHAISDGLLLHFM